MEKDFEESELNSKDQQDEVILGDISKMVYCGDISDNDYSPRTGLTSLEYLLFRNFDANTWGEVCDLKKKIYGKVIDLCGGSDLSNFECDKPKGLFPDHSKTVFHP